MTAIGGFYGGRKAATASALSAARDTVSLMESQIQILQQREAEKDALVQSLISRVEILEGMVLQREDLAQLKIDVREIKEMLNA